MLSTSRRPSPRSLSKKGPNYGAWSDGNAIGPVRLPAWGAVETMMASKADKKTLLGPFRTPVGGPGRVVDDMEDDTPAAKRARLANSEDESEPIFLHSADLRFYQDEVIMGSYGGVVDFTPGQGYLLWAAVSQKVPCVGFCMSPTHKERVRLHLLTLALKEMAMEGTPSYEPRLQTLIAESGDGSGPPPPSRSQARTNRGWAGLKAPGI